MYLVFPFQEQVLASSTWLRTAEVLRTAGEEIKEIFNFSPLPYLKGGGKYPCVLRDAFWTGSFWNPCRPPTSGQWVKAGSHLLLRNKSNLLVFIHSKAAGRNLSSLLIEAQTAKLPFFSVMLSRPPEPLNLSPLTFCSARRQMGGSCSCQSESVCT